MTNEGQVNLCNITLSIENLGLATVKTPSWLPHYPSSQFFAAGTYFPFSAIMPVTKSTTYTYPTVDVSRGFYACDKKLKPLTQDQIVPPPGLDPVPAEDNAESSQGGTGTGASSAAGNKGKINWDGLVRSAGTKSSCLSPCLAGIKGEKDDCKSIAHILSSGCTSACPDSVLQYAGKACQEAACSKAQCQGSTIKTSSSSGGSRAINTSFSVLVLPFLITVYTAFRLTFV